jgi:hypothetical protein
MGQPLTFDENGIFGKIKMLKAQGFPKKVQELSQK